MKCLEGYLTQILYKYTIIELQEQFLISKASFSPPFTIMEHIHSFFYSHLCNLLKNMFIFDAVDKRPINYEDI